MNVSFNMKGPSAFFFLEQTLYPPPSPALLPFSIQEVSLLEQIGLYINMVFDKSSRQFRFPSLTTLFPEYFTAKSLCYEVVWIFFFNSIYLHQGSR